MARTKLRTLLDSTTTESSTLPCHDSAQTATLVAAASTRTESEGSEVQVISIRPCQTQRLLKPPKLTFTATLAGGTIAPGTALCRSERLLADCLRPAPHRLHTIGSVVRRPVSRICRRHTSPLKCLPTYIPNERIVPLPTLDVGIQKDVIPPDSTQHSLPVRISPAASYRNSGSLTGYLPSPALAASFAAIRTNAIPDIKTTA